MNHSFKTCGYDYHSRPCPTNKCKLVIAVSSSLQELAPVTDVAIELGGEDAKIIYFEGGNVEQRMNGICAGGTGSFIDQMASI